MVGVATSKKCTTCRTKKIKVGLIFNPTLWLTYAFLECCAYLCFSVIKRNQGVGNAEKVLGHASGLEDRPHI